MKKLFYESPTVDIVDVRVESGFVISTYADGGIGDYSTVSDGDMTPVDSY